MIGSVAPHQSQSKVVLSLEEKASVQERRSYQNEQSNGIGEATERELSLSREDDSDLSVMLDSSEEEMKRNGAQLEEVKGEPVHSAASPEVADEEGDAGDASESESIEGSELEDLSEFDEAAQRKDEHEKLVKILNKRDQRVNVTTTSKVKCLI